MYVFGDGVVRLLVCGEGMNSFMGRLRGMPDIGEMACEERFEKLLRGDSIPPEGRKESDGCLDMLD
jgi:hypothetical protein